MHDRLCFHFLSQIHLLQPALQDRLDAPLRRAADRERSRARRLEPRMAVPLAQPHQPQARPPTRLRVRPPRQDRSRYLGRLRPFRLRPAHEPLGGPVPPFTMRARPVLGPCHGRTLRPVTALVRRDAHAVTPHLHQRRRRAHIDLGGDELARHAVVAMVKLDVVVEVDTDVQLPLTDLVPPR